MQLLGQLQLLIRTAFDDSSRNLKGYECYQPGPDRLTQLDQPEWEMEANKRAVTLKGPPHLGFHNFVILALNRSPWRHGDTDWN